ncbi:hypothetical protein VNO80_13447 [Phaseolus coccineus]|uniref:Uncharacterized protein n=1 Tax=Phaseolus coccineus TaxID=3886 RepID=A0AAN9N307_PHACN
MVTQPQLPSSFHTCVFDLPVGAIFSSSLFFSWCALALVLLFSFCSLTPLLFSSFRISLSRSCCCFFSSPFPVDGAPGIGGGVTVLACSSGYRSLYFSPSLSLKTLVEPLPTISLKTLVDKPPHNSTSSKIFKCYLKGRQIIQKESDLEKHVSTSFFHDFTHFTEKRSCC